jgi:hypothetical protein
MPKQISLSEFKKLSAKDIKESPCLEITSDGTHLFFAVIGSQEGMRDKIQGYSSQIDAGRGK